MPNSGQDLCPHVLLSEDIREGRERILGGGYSLGFICFMIISNHLLFLMFLKITHNYFENYRNELFHLNSRNK